MEELNNYLNSKLKQVEAAPKSEVERGYKIAVTTMVVTMKSLIQKTEGNLASIGVISGKAAERFVERMNNVKPISKEKRVEMEANYKAIMKKAKL